MTTLGAVGLTTKTFMRAIENKQITHEEVIRWAASHGLKWVELRDDRFTIPQEELTAIRECAAAVGIHLHYAWDGNDLLADDDEYSFKTAMQRAAIFERPVCCRITISTGRYKQDPAKKGYSREEFKKLCATVNKYETIAAEHQAVIVYENAFEPLRGDGSAYYGIEELMTACPTMRLTLDAGNFLNARQVRVLPVWEDIRLFFERFRDRIHYIHLKSTKNNRLLDVLTEDSDADLNYMLAHASEQDWLCIELPGVESAELCKLNVRKAITLVSGQRS